MIDYLSWLTNNHEFNQVIRILIIAAEVLRKKEGITNKEFWAKEDDKLILRLEDKSKELTEIFGLKNSRTVVKASDAYKLGFRVFAVKYKDYEHVIKKHEQLFIKLIEDKNYLKKIIFNYEGEDYLIVTGLEPINIKVLLNHIKNHKDNSFKNLNLCNKTLRNEGYLYFTDGLGKVLKDRYKSLLGHKVFGYNKDKPTYMQTLWGSVSFPAGHDVKKSIQAVTYFDVTKIRKDIYLDPEFLMCDTDYVNDFGNAFFVLNGLTDDSLIDLQIKVDKTDNKHEYLKKLYISNVMKSSLINKKIIKGDFCQETIEELNPQDIDINNLDKFKKEYEKKVYKGIIEYNPEANKIIIKCLNKKELCQTHTLEPILKKLYNY